jgi:hypothetical protein
LSVGERDILQAFTQFLPRVLEQSLISGIHPEFNGNSVVYFNHVSFSAHLLENVDVMVAGGKCVEIREVLSGSLVRKAASILAACAFLNVSRINLKAALGKVAGIYSKSLGYQVTVNLVGQPLTDDPINHRSPINYPILNLIGIALSDLVGNSIYIYHADRATLYGTYPSYSQAIKALNPVKCNGLSVKQTEIKSRSLQRFTNSLRLVETENGSFYIARNPMYVTRKSTT